MAIVRTILGVIIGAGVWALLASLMLAAWTGLDNMTGGAIMRILQAGLASVPAMAPGALIFLGLGLLLFRAMGRGAQPVAAGVFGGLLFILVAVALDRFMGAGEATSLVTGLYPAGDIWSRIVGIASADPGQYLWLGYHLLIPLLSGAVGGGVYDAIAGAVKAERRRRRRPAVSFSE